jgi:hypothetical protein
MGATGIAWIGVTVLIFAALVVLSIWMRRRDAEEFEQGPSNLSDDDRRALQLGLGLTIGNGVGGNNF